MCGSAGGEAEEEPVCAQSAGERQEGGVSMSKSAKLVPYLSSLSSLLSPLTLGLPVGFSLALFLAFTDAFLVFDGDCLLSAVAKERELSPHTSNSLSLSLSSPLDMTVTLLIFSCPRVFPAKLSSVAGRSKQ